MSKLKELLQDGVLTDVQAGKIQHALRAKRSMVLGIPKIENLSLLMDMLVEQTRLAHVKTTKVWASHTSSLDPLDVLFIYLIDQVPSASNIRWTNDHEYHLAFYDPSQYLEITFIITSSYDDLRGRTYTGDSQVLTLQLD